MDNKTRVKIAVVIGIVVLAVIFIFMVIFVKGNKTPVNKNIPKKTEQSTNKDIKSNDVDSADKDEQASTNEVINLNNIESIGIENGNLVKIDNNLNSSIITKLENGYSEYCYGDNKVYIVFNNQDGSCLISEIDLLKSNYPQNNILNTSDYGFIYNTEYYAGKLYFVSERGQLVEYSISEDFTRNLTNEGEVSYFTVDEKNNRLYVSYKPNGENPGIYLLDFTANTFSQIITLNDLSGQLMLKDSTLAIDVKEFESIYVYNTESNSIVGIGTDRGLINSNSHITFYDNVLLYTDGNKIDIKDSSGNSYQDGWYNLNDNSIADISMLNSSKLQVSRYDESGKVTRSIVIDLSNGETTEMDSKVYSELVKIK